MESNSLSLETILERVSEIALQIQSGKFLDDILQWAIADTRALLDVDRVLVYRFLGDRDAVVAFESTQSGCPPVMGQLIYDPCFDAHWLKPYQQGQTSVCADIEGSDLSPCYIDLMRRLQVRANIVVPLWCQTTLWGLLIVHHCRGARDWQPIEVQYVEQIALHLGTAIQQSRLQPPSQTEQTLAEVALRNSQQQLSTLISNLPGYVYRVHNDANYTPEFISQGVTKVTGYQPEEYLVERSISCGQEIHPDDAERVWETVQAALGDRQAYECEYRIITKTGQQKWVWERGRGIYGEDGSLQWLEGFVTDISDRKQKDDMIRNIAQGVSAKTGDAFFHSLVHYLLQMLEMDHIFVSALTPPHGATVKVIAGLSRGQSLDGAEFSLAGTPCENAIAQGFWICTEQIQQRFPQSAMLHSLGAESYAGIPLLNSDGVVIGVIGVLSNQAIANVEFIQEVLTIFAVRAASELERQQDEALLRRYERIVSATPDCVSLLDRNYCYQIINQTYLDWNQKSSDQIIGHSVAELLGQDFFENSAKPLLDRCLAGEAKLSVDSWLNYRDGQQRFVRATYAPFIETDGTISGVVINVHDLTELKRTEETLREQQQFTKQIAESTLALLYVYDLVRQRNVYA
ncbi:MAG TPA: GAF domain-containing protein, partial [Chroococcidiopsis sp.]